MLKSHIIWLLVYIIAVGALPANVATYAVDDITLIQVNVHIDTDASTEKPTLPDNVAAELRFELAEFLANFTHTSNFSNEQMHDLLGLVRTFRNQPQTNLCETLQSENADATSLISLERNVDFPGTLDSPDEVLKSLYGSRYDWINNQKVGIYVFILAVIVAFIILCIATEWILEILSTRIWQKGKLSQERSRSTIIKILLPFWTSARTWPRIQFLLHFFGSIIFALSTVYWFCMLCLTLFGMWMPFLIEDLGIYDDWNVKILTLVGLVSYPALWWFTYEGFKDHKKPWGLWCILMILEILMVAWVVEQSVITMYGVNALNIKDATGFWNSKYIEFIAQVWVVIYYFCQSMAKNTLALEWRANTTDFIVSRYMTNRQFYKMEELVKDDHLLDNPDQRICEDIRALTFAGLEIVCTIILILMRLFGFAAVIWNASPDMGLMAIGYAIVSSILCLSMMSRLKSIKYRHQQAEGYFRFALAHIRNNSESIAFYNGEGRSVATSMKLFNNIVQIVYRHIYWSTLCGIFDKSYLYLAMLIVPLMLVPAYMRGDIPLGIITQAEIAVSNTLGCASVIIIRVPLFLTVATDMNRITALYKKLTADDDDSEKVYRETTPEAKLEIRDLTVMGPNNAPLCKNLCMDAGITGGGPMQRVIIIGPSGIGKSSLMRVISGLWTKGQGQVTLPQDCMFLPQRPYMPIGNLRMQITYPDIHSQSTIDDELRCLLEEVQLGSLPDRFGDGFDHVCDWSQVLSSGEQQRLAAARLILRKPRFAFLDEATTALPISQEASLYRLLMNRGIAYVSIGHRRSLLKHHDKVIQLQGSGAWNACAVEDYMVEPKQGCH